MSNAPYLLQNARSGRKLGHGEIIDSMIHDGLWDAYSNKHMGNCAEMLVRDRGYSRQDQDNYAIESYNRAKNAIDNGVFNKEIIPVKVKSSDNEQILISVDEELLKVNYEKIPQLKPAFEKKLAIRWKKTAFTPGYVRIILNLSRAAGSLLIIESNHLDPVWIHSVTSVGFDALKSKATSCPASLFNYLCLSFLDRLPTFLFIFNTLFILLIDLMTDLVI